MRLFKYKKMSRRGADLVQTSLYGIIAVGIIAAAYVSFNSINTNNKAQASAQQFLRMHSIIQQAHASTGDYGTGNLSSFLIGHGFPESEVSSATPPLLMSPLGTPFTLFGEKNSEMRFRYTGLAIVECEEISNTFLNLNGALKIHGSGKSTPLSDVTPSYINDICDNVKLNSKYELNFHFLSN